MSFGGWVKLKMSFGGGGISSLGDMFVRISGQWDIVDALPGLGAGD